MEMGMTGEVFDLSPAEAVKKLKPSRHTVVIAPLGRHLFCSQVVAFPALAIPLDMYPSWSRL